MKLHINQKIFFLLRKFYVFYNFYFIKKYNLNYYKPENSYEQNEKVYSKKFSIPGSLLRREMIRSHS